MPRFSSTKGTHSDLNKKLSTVSRLSLSRLSLFYCCERTKNYKPIPTRKASHTHPSKKSELLLNKTEVELAEKHAHTARSIVVFADHSVRRFRVVHNSDYGRNIVQFTSNVCIPRSRSAHREGAATKLILCK